MFDDFWKHCDDYQERRRREFEKLATDPPGPANVGDRVLVSCGVVGMGFDWEREEAEVLEAANTAYRVRFTHRKHMRTDEPIEKWIHIFAVTDVLGPAVAEKE